MGSQQNTILRYHLLALLLTSAVMLKCGSCHSLSNVDEKLLKMKIELKQDIQAQGEQIKQLQDTLSKLVHALLNGKSEIQDDAGHVIKRRDTNSSEHILSNLPIGALAGLRGTPGRNGRDGIGKDGRDGRDGINGKNGINGINGNEGKDGSPGTPGLTGVPGVKGEPGKVGEAGLPGTPGNKGASGAPGNPGTSGAAGRTGLRGRSGVAGTPGSRGPPGRDNTANAGAVYTRWGRTACGNGSTLIYHGFTGGSRYAKSGGGVNYQCLPLTPEYNRYGNGGSASSIVGAEYESSSSGIFLNSAHDQNVPCARCYTGSRSAVMMQPAKRNCPSGWNKEYEGYLMTEYSGHAHSATYECVDAAPEYISGFHANTNGALFYFVKPICSGTGTIGHCPPYDSNKQLTCVVCTK